MNRAMSCYRSLASDGLGALWWRRYWRAASNWPGVAGIPAEPGMRANRRRFAALPVSGVHWYGLRAVRSMGGAVLDSGGQSGHWKPARARRINAD